MFPTKTYSIMVLIVLLSYTSNAFNWQAKGKATKQKNQKPIYSTVAFDISIDKLPANYLGHEYDQIYNILKSRLASTVAKDEFETSQQYQQRLSDLQNKPLSDSLNQNSIFAFKPNFINPEYDADSQTMTVTLSLWPSDDYQKLNITLKYDDQEVGSYLGTNAFGASRNVDRIETTWNNLSVNNSYYFSTLNEEKSTLSKVYFRSKIIMEPALAKAIKSSLQALFVCKLVKPFVSNDSNYESPKYSDPYSKTTNIYFIHADIIEVIIYNMTTGEIIKKIK